MCEIIRQWIQEKLGIIINLKAETFCDLTRDGLLLCRILRNYEVINEDQFNMIEKSNVKTICLKNFQQHIAKWLKYINIELSPEEIGDIINCNGLSSLSLFYRVFLELHEKDCLTFITKNRLSEKLRPSISKYSIQNVRDGQSEQFHDDKYKDQLQNSYDVIHWLQDRLEMVVTKCKSAREEYVSMMRSTEKRISSPLLIPNDIPSYEDISDNISNHSAISLEMTFGDLIKEKREIRKLKSFQPNLQESINILEKIKDKLKDKAENKIFMKELQKHILHNFWDKIIEEESEDFNKDIAEKMLKQSAYEKQMQKKLREVKYQKENMLQSKKILCDTISKEKETEFVERLVEHNDQMNKNDFQYYLEKERALQLHRAIYKEKLRLKAERTFKLCEDAVRGICNMAIKLSEYRSYFGEEPSERILDSWKKMVSSGHDFEDPDVKMEDLVTTDPRSIETIVHKEIEKQNEMDEKDFQSYISFDYPWILQNVSEDQVKEMNNGMNILGHIVHQLLTLKYPLPVLPTPPNLPNVDVRVCINGLPDLSCLQLLQKLLEYKGILVVELQDAVNYCINAYKDEGYDEIMSIDEEEENTLYDDEKSEVFRRKGEKSKTLKTQSQTSGNDLDIQRSDKCFQTPRLFPGEKQAMSPSAELGKIAYDELSLGNYLTDFLMVSMFIEYMKTQQDNIKGWVLINYPTNFEQAVLFEEALSGLEVPGVQEKSKIFKSLTDIVYVCEQQKMDIEDERRFSKLLTDPSEIREPADYDTVLTAFINVYADNEVSSEGDIPKEVVNIEDSSKLQQFYTDQGCNYSVHYQIFDYFTVKHIAKLIIGDFSLPPKRSVELFGDTIRYLDAEKGENSKSAQSLKQGEKKEGERIEKVIKNKQTANIPQQGESFGSLEMEKNGKKPRNSTIISREEKWTQIPEIKIIEVEEEEPPKPGEQGWNYENLLISEEIGVVLAEIWENMEEIYINDLSQVFFQKRILLNTLMPYVDYVKKHIRKFIMKPDQRQLHLRKIQETFNKFDDDFRRDKEIKAELHYLIHEMKNRLMDLVDIRMDRAEQQRKSLIAENWGSKQIIELSNIYLSGFQIELDRFCDTLTFINDYFTGLITQVPCEDMFLKELLQKFNLDNSEIERDINNILLNVDSILPNPMTYKIDHIYRKVLSLIERYEANAFTGYEKIKSMFLTENSSAKGKVKPAKMRGSGKGAYLTVFEPSEKIKQHSQYIFDGWFCTLKGELARIKIRMKLLRSDLNENVDIFLNTLKNTLHSLYEENRLKYEREISNINNVCYVISIAIENEIPLQEELLLTDDHFLVNPENIVFPDPPQRPPKPPDGCLYSLNQLRTIMEIFFDLAPDGYLSERTFTFLLQDMVSNNDKDMAPIDWTKLTGPNIDQISKDIFGPQEYVYWKDYIIYNLNIQFPTVKEILEIRQSFTKIDEGLTELIHLEDFKSIKFWFENDSLDNDSIKMLLFRLYKVDEDFINYTPMLLDFCKSDTTLVGLAKALVVVSGKLICWDKSIGEMFKIFTLEQRKLHEQQVKLKDEEREKNVEFAQTIVDSLIDQTVHACDSVVITEIPNEDEVTKDLTNIELDKESLKSPKEEDDDQIKKTSSGSSDESNLNEQLDFSNVAIGFEAKGFPSFEYFLCYDDVVTVFSGALNWKMENLTVENIIFYKKLRNIYESCKSPDFNDQVLSHEYLNNSNFLKLLEKTKKFLIIHPYELVENFLIEMQLKEW